MSKVVTTTSREPLPCQLTDTELIERARELASAGRDIENEEASQSAMKAQMRSRMKELNAKRDNLNGVVASSREYRNVTVVERRDYSAGTIERIREDTGEVLSKRTMVDDERQIPLDAVEDDFEVKCRVCGCTENDCSQCVEKTGSRCQWVHDPQDRGDLCSACLPEIEKLVRNIEAGAKHGLSETEVRIATTEPATMDEAVQNAQDLLDDRKPPKWPAKNNRQKAAAR